MGYQLEFTDDGGIGVNSVHLPTRSVAAADSPVTAAGADQIILANATAGAITINLPAAAGRRINGRSDSFLIVKTDSSSNAVTIDANGSETINGAATLALAKQYASVEIFTDGTNWFTKNGNVPQAAVAALTDNTAGTANDALQALADGSTYANDVAAIRNNFADLAAKVNAIRTALVNAGIIAP